MSFWVASTLRTPKAQHHAIASQVPVTVRLREDPKGSKWRIDELGIPQSGMMHDSTVVGRGLGLYAQYKLESLYTFSSTMPMQSSHYRCIVQTLGRICHQPRLLYTRHGTQAARINHSMLKHGQVCLVHFRMPWHHHSSGSRGE